MILILKFPSVMILSKRDYRKRFLEVNLINHSNNAILKLMKSQTWYQFQEDNHI